jgi:hypothetical protein
MAHSNQLIETIYSERREYQNNLQVMKIMASMGVTQELEAYMAKVITNILKSGDITNIQDPILLASIITHQVKAKEYNISIIVNCHKSLGNLDNISLKLGEVFNICLDLLIGNIITVKGNTNALIIGIEEDKAVYTFDFKNGEITILSQKKPSNKTNQTMNYAAELASIENIIKELNGNFYPIIDDGRIVRLKITINKSPTISLAKEMLKS